MPWRQMMHVISSLIAHSKNKNILFAILRVSLVLGFLMTDCSLDLLKVLDLRFVVIDEDFRYYVKKKKKNKQNTKQQQQQQNTIPKRNTGAEPSSNF